MAGNAVTIDFAGDASKLQAAAKRATAATDDVAASAKDAGADYDKAGAASDKYGQKMGDLGSATTGAIDAIDSLSGGLQAAADIQDYARDRAQRLARANVDVMQATEDMAQATRDAKQAQIDSEQAALDLTQARLDEKTALEEYNKAVKEHGKNSDEAKQAQIDLKQAGIDVKQALEDQEQATRDASQANIDAKTAQVDLNDAMHEANPPELQEWADMIGLVTPLLSAVVGVLGLVTAAQWLWNSALFASPLTWIVLAIAAVIAIIVLIATKTTWFQDLWRVTWGGIKDAASAVGSWFKDVLWKKWIVGAWDGIVNAGKNAWNWMKELPGKIKSSFSRITDFLFSPFRAAFNKISTAWNNTVGNLSWTVPGWVPGVGGNSISAPRLPTFHSGGRVPGAPGQEVPIMALAGETVLPPGRSGGGDIIIRSGGTQLDDLLVEVLSRSIGRRGGNVQLVLGGRNAA
jgi:hypothetical protein